MNRLVLKNFSLIDLMFMLWLVMVSSNHLVHHLSNLTRILVKEFGFMMKVRVA
jgi:hypothetical protein